MLCLEAGARGNPGLFFHSAPPWCTVVKHCEVRYYGAQKQENKAAQPGLAAGVDQFSAEALWNFSETGEAEEGVAGLDST